MAATTRITLRAPPDGLPDEVAFTSGATTFRVTLGGSNGDPGCEQLALDARSERFDRSGGFSTARLVMEGPPGVGLRFLEPYWEDRFDQWEEPPDLPLDLSDVPPITLAIPNSLRYSGLGRRGHRQAISLSWYFDLHLAAVAPGCPPLTLRCRIRSNRTPDCRRF